MSELAALEFMKAPYGTQTDESLRAHMAEQATLRTLSTRIGRDPLLVQASSGNTSLKLDEWLWIKASGTWLANAEQHETFVSVNLDECRRRFREGRPLPGGNHGPGAPVLRPSIETFMHAVLPQRVVVHVHSVSTLAWAVRSDGPRQLAQRLSGLAWRWVPYVPSGLPLAREMQPALSTDPKPDIFILGNHGLVVCGESCEAVEKLLAEVDARLATNPRPVQRPTFDLHQSVRGVSSWRVPSKEAIHVLGTDVFSRQILKRGVLYPCQAIFLGRKLHSMRASKNGSEMRARLSQVNTSCAFVVVEGVGVLIRSNITAAEYAVLIGLAEAVRRIDPWAPIRYLTDAEVDTAVNADGHTYRMAAENNA